MSIFFRNPLLKSDAVIEDFPSRANCFIRMKLPSLQYTRKHLLFLSYSTQPGGFSVFDSIMLLLKISISFIFTRRLCQHVVNHLNENKALYKLQIYLAFIVCQLMLAIESGTFGAAN